jgi:hypothetical protein
LVEIKLGHLEKENREQATVRLRIDQTLRISGEFVPNLELGELPLVFWFDLADSEKTVIKQSAAPVKWEESAAGWVFSIDSTPPEKTPQRYRWIVRAGATRVLATGEVDVVK